MASLPSLITDLGVIVILGSIFALLCKWLKQPVVLGYIIAGFIAGPHFHLFQTVQPENISTWADIGVIFLLFGMGLEFSFKKLLTIGKIGGKAIGFVIIALGLTGFGVGQLIGWKAADSILLGAMLVMSSTAMIVKSLTDMGYSKEKFAQIVFGILIFDDLFAILAMVILSTFAASAQFHGGELAMVLVRLIFFIVIWIVVGIYLIPTFLKKTKRHLNDEILMLIAIGLCLAMVMLSVKVGFSSALGAFVMGSILAETLDQERISKVVAPLRDFFGMIFFVSVGMMVDPKILTANIGTIIIISLIPIVFKNLFYIVGVKLAGESLETSVRAGFSMSQMGEFSFIVAQTGISLGLISPQVYPVAIAVSVLTTFVTPYSIRLGEPAYNLITKLLPYDKYKRLYDGKNDENIQTDSETTATESEKNVWSQYLKSYFSRLALYIIICVAILLVSFNLLLPLADTSKHYILMRIVFCLATLIVMAPLLRGMIHNMGKQAYLYLTLYTDNNNNRLILSFLTTIRYVIAIVFAFFVITKYSHVPSWVDIIVAIVFFAVIFNSKRLLRYNWSIESRFVKNFNARQIVEQSKKTKSKLNELDNLHWIDSNMYFAEYLVTSEGKLNGKSLKELNFRKEYNVLVISVRRDGEEYSLVGGDFTLMGGDILYMLGTLGSLRRLDMDDDSVSLDYTKIKTLNDFNLSQKADENSQLHCVTFQIEKGSEWIGKTLMDSSLMKSGNPQEQACSCGNEGRCMVVAIERNDTPIINPSSHLQFEENDTVWVIGDKAVVYKLLEKKYF